MSLGRQEACKALAPFKSSLKTDSTEKNDFMSPEIMVGKFRNLQIVFDPQGIDQTKFSYLLHDTAKQ